MTKSTPFSAANQIREAEVDFRKWNTLPSPDIVRLTIRAVEDRGITVVPAADGDAALAILKKLIPQGAELMTGSSTTLIEIGFDEYIASGRSGWKSLHASITSENDEKKRAELRRKSVTADYFVSSANAIAQTGEIVACDAGGSRVGAWPFAAGHLILVVGINKITPLLELAMQRVFEYAFRLENARAQRAYGTPSSIGKCVILAREKIPGRVTLVLVNEALGY
ncbi:lactate utilization protein [Methanoregula sp.]|jgi:L-lactate utilization protein LutB|uniref:lactate utilization protein n=1 Tax=Methanoregula sp. TaxID=2052170 RepID=UPI003C1E7EA5